MPSDWRVLRSAAVVLLCSATHTAEAQLIKVKSGAKSPPQAYFLVQNSTLIGTVNVTLCGNDARFDCINLQSSLFVSGKDNTATLLNHKSKLYWRMPAAEWHPATFQLTNILSFADIGSLTYKETKPTSLFSMPATSELYFNPQHFQGPPVTKPEKLTPVSGALTTMPSLSTNKNIFSAASKLYYVPAGHAYPLKFDAKNRKGGEKHDLTTSSLVRKPLEPGFLVVPAEYRLAKSLRDASITASANSVMEDFADISK